MKIGFRVSASPMVGSGHLMRCLALAKELQEKNIASIFYLSYDAKTWGKELCKNNIEVSWLNLNTPEYLQQCFATQKCKIAVMDGYEFDESYCQSLKNHGIKLFIIDDLGNGSFSANWLLNQNLGFSTENYKKKCQKNCQLLLGPSYSLLRKEFAQTRKQSSERKFHEVKNILVSMGGSDTKNMTSKVIKAIENLSTKHPFKITIIVGKTNLHLEEIKHLCQKTYHHYEIVQNTHSIAQYMYFADIAIGAGGSTNWECLCLGLPTLVIMVADNQIKLANELAKQELASLIGWYSDLTENKITEKIESFISNQEYRKMISERGMKLVDGLGAKRVSNFLLENLN